MGEPVDKVDKVEKAQNFINFINFVNYINFHLSTHSPNISYLRVLSFWL